MRFCEMFTKRYICREFWTRKVIDIVKAEIMVMAMARARAHAVQLLDEAGKLRRQEWIKKETEYQVKMEKQKEFNKAEKKLEQELYMNLAMSLSGASGSGATVIAPPPDHPPADNAGNADDAGGVGTGVDSTVNVNITDGDGNQPKWPAGHKKWHVPHNSDQIVKSNGDQWNGNRKQHWNSNWNNQWSQRSHRPRGQQQKQ